MIAALRRCTVIFLCAGALFANASECNVVADLESVKQYLQAKRYDDATAALDKLKTCGPPSSLQLFEMGWMYGRARRFDKALVIFKSVPVDVPDRVNHQYAIALTHFELGDYRETISVLKALEAVGPLNPEAANLLGVSYSKLGLHSQAEPVLTGEIERNPNDLTAYLNLVTLYAEQGKFADARKIAAAAVVAFPNSSEVFVVRGAANTLLGLLDEAYGDFSKAASLAPDAADPQFFLALTRYKQGRFSDAAGSLTSAIHGGIADSDLHYLLAECLLKMDGEDKRPVMTELDIAIEMNATSVSARALRGKLLLQAGRPSDAVADLELALKKDPSSRSAAYNLAHAYQKLGRTEDARPLLEQFRQKQPDTLGELSQRRLNQALKPDKAQP